MGFLYFLLGGFIVGVIFFIVQWKKGLNHTQKPYEDKTPQLKALEAKIAEKQEQAQRLDDYLESIKREIQNFKEKRQIINEEILRQKKIQERELFYKINVSENDIEDIQTIEQIRPILKNKEAISKLIWDVYLKRPTTEMVKRITEGREIGGIYKITYVKTGESYIGKTSSFKKRWQDHVKTSLGLDGCARSTLHTRLAKDGLWNYTFEILEEVGKEKQTKREKYWIEFYETQKFGLNQRVG